MDDARFRQQQMDQPQSVKVEWRLVGYPGRVRPDPAKQSEIVPRQIVRRFRGEIRRIRDARTARAPGPEGQFAARSDRRMTRNNLLDQGRAGTRHTEDQQRGLVVQLEGLTGGKESRGETLNQAIAVSR